VTRHTLQLFKVKRSKVKVTRLRDVSADKNAITRQYMVTSTSNLVRIIDVGVDACGILSRSVGQTSRKWKCGGHSEYANATIFSTFEVQYGTSTSPRTTAIGHLGYL